MFWTHRIRNLPLMDRLCDFLIDNISNQISTRTRQEAYQYEGVQIIDVADWLLHD